MESGRVQWSKNPTWMPQDLIGEIWASKKASAPRHGNQGLVCGLARGHQTVKRVWWAPATLSFCKRHHHPSKHLLNVWYALQGRKENLQYGNSTHKWSDTQEAFYFWTQLRINLPTAPAICSAFKCLSAAVSEHCWSSLCFFLRVQLAGLIPGWKGAWEHFWEYHRYLCFLWLLLLCPLFCPNEVIGSLVFKSADNTWRDIPFDTAYTAGLCSVEVIMVPVDAIYVKQALIFSLQ